MGMVENSKSVLDRKENKQRNFVKSETKHLFRSHNKNAENAIFRTRDETHQSLENDVMLGITGGGRKKEREAPCAVDGRHQKCNWTLGK